jgi:hypothetical protein
MQLISDYTSLGVLVQCIYLGLKNQFLWAKSEMSGYAGKLCNRNNGVMEWWVADHQQIYKIHGYFDNNKLTQVPNLDPIFQYSITPAFQPHIIGCQSHSFGVKPKHGSFGQDSLLFG